MSWQVEGEWWVTPDMAIFCDGGADISVPHHADVIAQHLLSELADLMGDKCPYLLPAGGVESLEGDCIMFMEDIHLRTDEAFNDGKINEVDADDIFDYICKKVGWSDEKMNMLTGRDNQELLNMYGIKDLGWVRQHQNNCQVWQLTPTVLRMWLDKGPPEDDEIPGDALFDFDIRSTNRMLLSVPYEVLTKCRQSLRPLTQYRRLLGENIPVRRT